MTFADTFVAPFQLFFNQLALFIPKLLAAYVIWLVGKQLIEWAVVAIDRLDVKSWEFDDVVREKIKNVFVPTSKIILVLVILDTFGIATSFVSAIVSGITYTLAIALGLAFGKALEPEAKDLTQKVKHMLSHK